MHACTESSRGALVYSLGARRATCVRCVDTNGRAVSFFVAATICLQRRRVRLTISGVPFEPTIDGPVVGIIPKDRGAAPLGPLAAVTTSRCSGGPPATVRNTWVVVLVVPSGHSHSALQVLCGRERTGWAVWVWGIWVWGGCWIKGITWSPRPHVLVPSIQKITHGQQDQNQ